MANEVTIVVKGEDQTKAAFDSAKKGAHGLQGALQDVGKTAAGFLTASAVTQGLSFFKGQIGSVFAEAREAREIGLQTAAVIKSTGGVAGVSAKQVEALANSLSTMTNFDDEAIQSAENLLLTFTSIGKDVFPAATETVLNMSQALGQDLKSSAIQLGKAMNDPITGATALRRVGVALTEQQMDQIKAFQESGDILSAQGIIMKELAVEFGGSAKATADPLKILGNTIANLKEQIGLALLPAAMAMAKVLAGHVVPALAAAIKHVGTFVSLIKTSLTGDVAKAAELFNELPKPLQELALWLARNKDEIIGFASVVKSLAGDVLEGWKRILVELGPPLLKLAEYIGKHKPLMIALGVAVGILVVALIGLPIVIAAVIVAVGLLAAHWDSIKKKTIDVWNSVPTVVQDAIKLIVEVVKTQFLIVKNEIETVLNVIRDVIKIATALWNGDWGEAWEGIKQLGIDIFQGFVTDITLKLGLLRDTFAFVFGAIRGVVGDVWEKLKTDATSALNWIIDKLNALIGKINGLGGALSKIGIDAPDISGIPTVTPPYKPGGPMPVDPNFGFAAGTPFVPRDMLAMVHRGERIIPAAQNNGDGINISINVMASHDVHSIVEMVARKLEQELIVSGFRGSHGPTGAYQPVGG